MTDHMECTHGSVVMVLSSGARQNGKDGLKEVKGPLISIHSKLWLSKL